MTRQINLQRRFQIIEGADLPERKVDQRWDDFESAHAIVMLGPPGSGKTTVFQGLAEANPHGTYKTVRSLLRTPNGELRGSVLYLDALDEARPDRTERDKIDSVIKKLGELGRPSFRISCREADWLGASDLRALKDAVPDKKKLLVVSLEPLNDEEVQELAKAFGEPNPHEFIASAKERGVEDLLRNPETLRLLVEAVRQGGAW